MHKIKKAVRVIFALTVLTILSIVVGSVIGSELSYNVTPEYDYSPISYTQTNLIDNNFIKDKQYVAGGVDGSDLTVNTNFEIQNTKILLSSQNKHTDPVNKFVFNGSLSVDELIQKLNKKLSTWLSSQKTVDNSERYENVKIETIELIAENNFEINQKFIHLGAAQTFMENCHFYNNLNLVYNVVNKTYEFTNEATFLENLCSKYKVPDSPLPTACNDCTFYPVDKKHPLDQNYAVEVVNADGIVGGQQFAKFAYQNLLDLYLAAKDAGFNMRLTSAYRSYQDQQEVYEGWVQYEMGFGKSRAQAESDANSYSALPGFSEHQLGTTADISAVECIGIETVCHANELFWDWLSKNAYKYGFVMSYPMAKDSLTGYIHEPWHYRFIGVELANEYKTKYESRSYLAEFLRNKKLY